MIRRSATLAGVGILLIACQTTQPENVQPVTRLAPMQEPNPLSEGTVIHGLSNGAPTSTEVIKVDGNIRVLLRDNCEVTRDRTHGYFAPEVRWENCEGRSGQHIFHGKSGNIWPLAVGKSETYRATGKTKDTWSATRTCKVEGQSRVKTHIGTHDAFEVVCRTKWATRTYYMSPTVGRFVKYTKRKAHPQSRVTNEDWELTRIEFP